MTQQIIRRAAAWALIPAALFLILSTGSPAWSQTKPYVKVNSLHDFKTTAMKLQAAAKANKIGIVNRASATKGAASIGVKIPGNMVWGLFAPRFAVRMLEASVDAGYEAPVRLYIVEAPNGKVTVRYRKPSDVFRPYHKPELNAMARELDKIFANVVNAIR